MPRLSQWMIRTSLLYLGVGSTFGALMLFNKGILIDARLWRLLPAHLDSMIFGWVVQLALGVAYWILPRHAGGQRGPVAPGWISYAVFNLGVMLSSSRSWLVLGDSVLAIGLVGKMIAIGVFLWLLWPRVKALGA